MKLRFNKYQIFSLFFVLLSVQLVQSADPASGCDYANPNSQCQCQTALNSDNICQECSLNNKQTFVDSFDPTLGLSFSKCVSSCPKVTNRDNSKCLKSISDCPLELLIDEIKNQCSSQPCNSAATEDQVFMYQVTDSGGAHYCKYCPYLRKYQGDDNKCSNCLDKNKAQDENTGTCIDPETCSGYLSSDKKYCWKDSCKKNEKNGNKPDGKNYFECQICDKTYLNKSDGTCVDSCDGNTITDDYSKQCLSQITDCQTYVSSDNTKCSYRCPLGEVPLMRVSGDSFIRCQKCVGDQIVDANLLQCVPSCTANQILQEKYQTCLLSQEDCTNEFEPQFLSLDGKKCLSSCGTNQQQSKITDLKSVCVCKSSTFIMTKTIDGNVSQECVNTCDDGYLGDVISGNCILKSACTTYTYNNLCYQTCPDNTYTTPSSIICVDQCDAGQITDKVKKSCYTSSSDCANFLIDSYTCSDACPKNNYQYNEQSAPFKCNTVCELTIGQNNVCSTCAQTVYEIFVGVDIGKYCGFCPQSSPYKAKTDKDVDTCQDKCSGIQFTDSENMKCLNSKEECTRYLIDNLTCSTDCPSTSFIYPSENNVQICNSSCDKKKYLEQDNNIIQYCNVCPQSASYTFTDSNQKDMCLSACTTKYTDIDNKICLNDLNTCKAYLIDGKNCSSTCSKIIQKQEAGNDYQDCNDTCETANIWFVKSNNNEVKYCNFCPTSAPYKFVDGQGKNNCLLNCDSTSQITNTDSKECYSNKSQCNGFLINQKECSASCPLDHYQYKTKLTPPLCNSSCEFITDDTDPLNTCSSECTDQKYMVITADTQDFTGFQQYCKACPSNTYFIKKNIMNSIDGCLSACGKDQIADKDNKICLDSKIQCSRYLIDGKSCETTCPTTKYIYPLDESTKICNTSCDSGTVYLLNDDLDSLKAQYCDFCPPEAHFKATNDGKNVCLTACKPDTITDNEKSACLQTQAECNNGRYLHEDNTCSSSCDQFKFNESSPKLCKASCEYILNENDKTCSSSCQKVNATFNSDSTILQKYCGICPKDFSYLSDQDANSISHCQASCSGTQITDTTNLRCYNDKSGCSGYVYSQSCVEGCSGQQVTDKSNRICLKDKYECSGVIFDDVYCQSDCSSIQYIYQDIVESGKTNIKVCKSTCTQGTTTTNVILDANNKAIKKYCGFCPSDYPLQANIAGGQISCLQECGVAQITDTANNKCYDKADECVGYVTSDNKCVSSCKTGTITDVSNRKCLNSTADCQGVIFDDIYCQSDCSSIQYIYQDIVESGKTNVRVCKSTCTTTSNVILDEQLIVKQQYCGFCPSGYDFQAKFQATKISCLKQCGTGQITDTEQQKCYNSASECLTFLTTDAKCVSTCDPAKITDTANKKCLDNQKDCIGVIFNQNICQPVCSSEQYNYQDVLVGADTIKICKSQCDGTTHVTLDESKNVKKLYCNTCPSDSPITDKYGDNQVACLQQCDSPKITDIDNKKCLDQKSDCTLKYLIDGKSCSDECPALYYQSTDTDNPKLCNKTCKFFTDGNNACVSNCVDSKTFSTLDDAGNVKQQYCDFCPSAASFKNLNSDKPNYCLSMCSSNQITDTENSKCYNNQAECQGYLTNDKLCLSKCKDTQITDERTKKCLDKKQDCTDFLLDDKYCQSECPSGKFNYQNEVISGTSIKICKSTCSSGTTNVTLDSSNVVVNQYCGFCPNDSPYQDKLNNGQIPCLQTCNGQKITDNINKKCLDTKAECNGYLVDGKICQSTCPIDKYIFEDEKISNDKTIMICNSLCIATSFAVLDQNQAIIQKYCDICPQSSPYKSKFQSKQNLCQNKCSSSQILSQQTMECLERKEDCLSYLVDGITCQTTCPSEKYKNDNVKPKLCNAVCEFISKEDLTLKSCQQTCQLTQYATFDSKSNIIQKYCDFCPPSSPYKVTKSNQPNGCQDKCDASQITDTVNQTCYSDKTLCKDFLIDGNKCSKDCPSTNFKYTKETTSYQQCDTACSVGFIVDADNKLCYKDNTECTTNISNNGDKCISVCENENQTVQQMDGYKQCKTCRNYLNEISSNIFECVSKCNNMIYISGDKNQQYKKCVVSDFCKDKKISANNSLVCSDSCITPEITNDNKCALQCPDGKYFSPTSKTCESACSDYLSSDGKLCTSLCDKVFEIVGATVGNQKNCQKCLATQFFTKDKTCKNITQTDDARKEIKDDLLASLTANTVQTVQEVQQAKVAIKTFSDQVEKKMADIAAKTDKTDDDQVAAKQAYQDIVDVIQSLLTNGNSEVFKIPVNIGSSEIKSIAQVAQPGQRFKTLFSSGAISSGTVENLLEDNPDSTSPIFNPQVLQVSYLKYNHFCKGAGCKNSPPLFIINQSGESKSRLLQASAQSLSITYTIPQGQQQTKQVCLSYDQAGNVTPSAGTIAQDQIICKFDSSVALLYDQQCQYINKSLCSDNSLDPIDQNTKQNEDDDNSLSGGAIAGIVIGIITILGLFGVVITYHIRQKRAKLNKDSKFAMNTDNDQRITDNRAIDTQNDPEKQYIQNKDICLQ